MKVITKLKYITIGVVIGMFVSSSIVIAALPDLLSRREYDKFVETNDGNVAIRAILKN